MVSPVIPMQTPPPFEIPKPPDPVAMEVPPNFGGQPVLQLGDFPRSNGGTFDSRSVPLVAPYQGMA